MGRILVTGSADGLGRETARRLAAGGHEVVLHARSARRLEDARAAVPGAADGVAGDLGSIASVRALGEAADAAGPYDAVVHNAGVMSGGTSEDGLPLPFQVNVLAPYVLTALIRPPGRLVYLSSGMHRGGRVTAEDLRHAGERDAHLGDYGTTKLLDVVLAFAVARRWADTASCAVDPGWVRTNMGGRGAPRDLGEGTDAQVWLATEADPAAIDGRYFRDRAEGDVRPEASDRDLQDALLEACERLTGVRLA